MLHTRKPVIKNTIVNYVCVTISDISRILILYVTVLRYVIIQERQ